MKKIVLLFIILISFQLFADNPIFATSSFFDKTGSKSFGIIEGPSKLTHSNYMEQAEASNNLYKAVVLKKTGVALIGIGAGFTLIGSVFCCLDGGTAIGLPFIIPGPIALVAGAVLLPLGAIREKEAKVKLENLSVAPTKGGVFTTVGFRF